MIFDINDFRIRYPEMMPYVGDNYELALKHKCALLVIGESHYLPPDSTIHKDFVTWYSSNHTKLTEKEKGWISTWELIKEELQKGFPQREHGIWKYGYQKINQWGPNFKDYLTLFQYTVFYNFYLRPANTGNTFRELCTPEDNNISNAYFAHMVKQYNPNGIIFLSRLAFESCGEKNKMVIPIAGAPHPTCCWWNRKCGKYGGRFGRDVVQDAMIGMDWSWTKHSN